VVAIGTKEQVQSREAEAFFATFRRTPVEKKEEKKEKEK
jgi:hypothetical protein